ncbi:hypothetical protein AMTRI_Chr09g21250 [Amborella trichopoda]
MHKRKGKPRISSWEEIKSRMKEKFLPVDYTQLFFSQFSNLRQETKRLAEYTKDFYKLMVRNGMQETEKQLVSSYINDAYQLGLNVEVSLSYGDAWKYDEVHSFYPPSKG